MNLFLEKEGNVEYIKNSIKGTLLILCILLHTYQFEESNFLVFFKSQRLFSKGGMYNDRRICKDFR